MAKNTSITLGNHFETLIENSIASGRYASASEVISAELRKIEEEEQKIIALKDAIEAGENSSYITDFDPEKFLERMHAKHSK